MLSLNMMKNEMLGFYEEEGLIQKEFEEHLSFKISSPGTHRICGFNLFTWVSGTPVSYPYLHVYLMGGVWVFYPSIFPMGFTCLAYHTPSNEYWSNLMEYESQWSFVATWLAVARLFTWTVFLGGQSFFQCEKDVKVMLVFLKIKKIKDSFY